MDSIKVSQIDANASRSEPSRIRLALVGSGTTQREMHLNQRALTLVAE